MKCAWQAYLSLLPIRFRQDVDKLGKETLQETRLRLNAPLELITSNGSIWLEQNVCMDDLSFCINAASRYSPWSAATVAKGYITAPGGHRLGLCGESTVINGKMTGIRGPTSLCLRVARDFSGIAEKASRIQGSILIIGCPGSGKTTLLRDLIRQKSNQGTGCIGVVDERGEIFPYTQDQMCFPVGKQTDVITGCSKADGIDAILRNMGPKVIAVDEITAQEDCDALLKAGWCGVDLIATAHAGSRDDLFERPVYKPILKSRLFETVIILQADKSWRAERINLWA